MTPADDPPNRRAGDASPTLRRPLRARLTAWNRAVAALLVAGTAFGAPAQAPAPQAATPLRLPSLGEGASADLSVSAERRLGDQIMREARRDPDFFDDPVLQEYLQSVWTPLVAAARQVGHIDADTDRSFAWEAFLVHDRSVNAFAWPGGYVGINLGLIAITTTVDQLASVLAHELTHVTQRHIARSIAPQERASMVAIATMLLGILAASRSSNADVANAAIMGGQGAAIQTQLNFSRDMEREADRIGYGLLAGAGFSPAGMAAMFDRLDVANRLNDSGNYPYLRSHPLTVDRISEARNRTLLSQAPAPQPTLRHALMQMRARVLMDDGAQALQRFNGNVTSTQPIDRIAAQYGAALAASLLKDHARAETHFAQAQQGAAALAPRDARADRALRLLQAQLLLAKGDAARALQALDAVRDEGVSRPTLLLRAQALLALRRQGDAATAAAAPLRESTELLQTWVAEHPNDAAAWETLAGTAGALGLRLRSMRAGAEARAAVGDIGGAIDRLQAAQGATRSATGQDFIEASVIDARLRQFTALRRQIALEARGGSERKPPGDEPPPQ